MGSGVFVEPCESKTEVLCRHLESKAWKFWLGKFKLIWLGVEIPCPSLIKAL